MKLSRSARREECGCLTYAILSVEPSDRPASAFRIRRIVEACPIHEHLMEMPYSIDNVQLAGDTE